MGDTATYEIRDLCRIRIRGLSRFSLGDLNEKFAHFRSASQAPADLDVAIGPFVPDLAGTTNIDHRYFIKRNYAYFRESLPGLSFQAEIRGLEEERTEVRFSLLSNSKLNPANLLYRDIHLHSHVLQPLLECKLGRKGFFLVHGAAMAKAGRAAVLIGRGLSFKTTYCMLLAREGMEFLGDDLLLCGEGKVHAFPIHRRYFEFYLNAGKDLKSESELRGWNNVRMVRHLMKASRSRLVIAEPSRPDTLIVIQPRQGLEAPAAKPMALETALDKACLNMRMERNPPEPAKYVIGNFLNAYALVFPDHAFRNHWKDARAALGTLFSGVPAYALETDAEWRPENLDRMRALIQGA